MKNTRPTWDTTREPNLLRNTASGKYYGRFTLGGKQKWGNLETDVCDIIENASLDEAQEDRLAQVLGK
jgi:hypothetical protein